MRRYQGEPLPPNSRIAVLANDAIGNFVVGTPLMQMLRQKFQPFALDYYGGTRTWELVESSDLIDFAHPLHGAEPQATMQAMVARIEEGEYDLVVNMEWTTFAKTSAALLASNRTFVCGPSVGLGGRGDLAFPDDDRGALWADQEWISPSITEKYPYLRTGFIGEIFCRLAYLDGEVPGYRLPERKFTGAAPDVWIATAASLPEKLWTHSAWRETLGWCKERGLRVGLVGAPPARQKEFWQGDSLEDDLVAEGLVEDFRGKFTLPEVVGALRGGRAVLTIDNGILHLASGAGTPTVGLFRNGIHRLWAPPSDQLTVLTPDEGAMVREIPVKEVIGALERVLG